MTDLRRAPYADGEPFAVSSIANRSAAKPRWCSIGDASCQEAVGAKQASKARRTLLWLAGAGSAAIVAWLITASPDRIGETRCYRPAAERFLAGEQFYQRGAIAPFTYPPFMALAYAPFSLLPERYGRAAWSMANLALLAAIVWLTDRLIRPALPDRGARFDARRGWSLGLIALLTARYELPQLAYQGHDFYIYLFAMLAALAWASEANFRLGAWAGLAAAAKATPLLFLPVFLWRRRWLAAITMTGACVGASLLPDLLVKNPDGALWVVSWYQKFIAHVDFGAAPDVVGSWKAWNPLNQSLSGTLYRLFTWVPGHTDTQWNVAIVALAPATVRNLSLAAKLAVVGLLMYCVSERRTRGMSRDETTFCALGQVGAALSAMLLLSPMSSVQHFCMLLAPISFAVVDFVYRKRDPWVGAALFLATCNSVAAGDIIGRAAHLQLQGYGHLTWAALLQMAVCGYILHSRGKAAASRESMPTSDAGDDHEHPATLAIPLPAPARKAAKAA